jgi:hypothetical protein
MHRSKIDKNFLESKNWKELECTDTRSRELFSEELESIGIHIYPRQRESELS